MNKQRRKDVQAVIDKLSECLERIAELQQEEQEYFDSIPENLQQAERATTSDECISTMDDAQTEIQEAIGSLDQVINS